MNKDWIYGVIAAIVIGTVAWFGNKTVTTSDNMLVLQVEVKAEITRSKDWDARQERKITKNSDKNDKLHDEIHEVEILVYERTK